MFCFTDSTGECSSRTTATGDTAVWGECYSDSYIDYSDDEYKSEMEDLWMIIDRREWREYLKALWLRILGTRQYFNTVQFSKYILYYRRLLFSISGWLARKGRNKKN